MRVAIPNEIKGHVYPVLAASISDAELYSWFPVPFHYLSDPQEVPEPSKAAAVRLRSGELFVLYYGELSEQLTIRIPADTSTSTFIDALLTEVPGLRERVSWQRPHEVSALVSAHAGITSDDDTASPAVPEGKDINASQPADDRFSESYRKYYPRLVRLFISGFHVNHAEAEDLAQDVFRRFYETMHEYRAGEWILLETIARNVLYNRIHAKLSSRRVEVNDERREEATAHAENEHIEQHDEAVRRKQLYDAVAKLPPTQRRVLQLWLDGFTYADISRALSAPAATVKSELRSATERLRDRLGDDLVDAHEWS
jgi:RNA polymerase sigma factor (sigma-70 family)